MEPASTKRFRFRLSLKGLLGATTFLAVVLAGLRASDLRLVEEGLVIAWALMTVIGITLAPAKLPRLILAGLMCGAIGGCLPALLWYAKFRLARSSWIEDCGYPILALTLAGATAGAAVGLAAWLCARPRRLAVAAAVCAVVALTDYGWWSLAYWHPLRTVHFDPRPETFALSSDGQLLASDGETVQTWDTITGRLRPVQFGKPEFEHATSYSRMRFVAGDHRYLVAGRYGQNALHVFAVDDGREVSSLPLPAIALRFCRFIGEDGLVIGWCDSGRDKIGVWDTHDWKRKELIYDADRAENITISDDLSTIATGDTLHIQITRAGDPEPRQLALLVRPAGTPWLLSPDGRWLANGNRVTDLTTDDTTGFDEIVGFSPDGALVISLSRRGVGEWFDRFPNSIQTAPLLKYLRTKRVQFQVTATETSGGRIFAQSPWIDGSYGQVSLAESAGLLAIGMERGYNNYAQMWQIPNHH